MTPRLGMPHPMRHGNKSFPDSSHHDVICHNDMATYNTVFVNDQPQAFIDFDTAGPGPRIWDVAYAAYTYAPLAQFVPLPYGTTVP
jgi:Ser/Thr protein kinase RdoA (MazF antagonist)